MWEIRKLQQFTFLVFPICKNVKGKTCVLPFQGSVYIFYTFVYKNFNLPHYLQKTSTISIFGKQSHENAKHGSVFVFAHLRNQKCKLLKFFYFPKLICVFVLGLKRATSSNLFQIICTAGMKKSQI